MDRTRLDDLLERYGEVCTQRDAAKILGVVPRTIYRMMEEGRLRRIARGVDVRSINEYLENPYQSNLVSRKQKQSGPTISEGEFFEAARTGRWAPRR